ncbi:MAG: GNAT family N-acetyltransferase [Candidatus Hodarchaeota archaeon]
MKGEFYEDINRFNELVFPFLLKHEAENNLLFSLLNSLKEDLYRYGDNKPVLTSITENNKIRLVSIRTPPYNQVLSYTEDLQSIDVLIDVLIKKNYDLPGVLGFKEGAEKFVELWCRKKGISSELVTNERIYKLEHVAEETLGKNEFIKATRIYEDTILQWAREFLIEALSERTNEMIEQSLKRMTRAIRKGKIFLLLVNNKPVSMAQKAGKTPNGNVVNYVYTPPELRRRGYATECVAKLSRYILKEGNKYCFLFTDLINPTSNKIYQKIGYHAVIDVDEFKFIPK